MKDEKHGCKLSTLHFQFSIQNIAEYIEFCGRPRLNLDGGVITIIPPIITSELKNRHTWLKKNGRLVLFADFVVHLQDLALSDVQH